VLYQLPPNMPVNLERFDHFLKALPRTRRHAVEFREPSWYVQEIFDRLEHHKVALCLHDMKGSATGKLPIGPFVYVRFHGPEKYSGRYPDAVLDSWAIWLADRARAGRPIYAYFNNDVGGQAPRDAARLRQAIAARSGERQEGRKAERQEGEGAKVGRQEGQGGKVGRQEGQGRKAGRQEGQGARAGRSQGQGRKEEGEGWNYTDAAGRER